MYQTSCHSGHWRTGARAELTPGLAQPGRDCALTPHPATPTQGEACAPAHFSRLSRRPHGQARWPWTDRDIAWQLEVDHEPRGEEDERTDSGTGQRCFFWIHPLGMHDHPRALTDNTVEWGGFT